MSTEKKKLTELSDPELIKKLFPKKAVKRMQQVAHEKDAKKPRK